MVEEKITFWLQFKAMLIRNMLLKVRKKKKSIMELVLPVYILGILVVLRLIIPNPNFPEVDTPRKLVRLLDYFNNIDFPYNFTIGVAPNSSHVQKFLKEVEEIWDNSNNTALLDLVVFRSEKRLMKIHKRNPYAMHFGLVFVNDNPFNGSIKYNILSNPLWMKMPHVSEAYAPTTACRPLPFQNSSSPQVRATQDNSSDLMLAAENGNNFEYCPADLYYKSGFVVLQMLLDFTKIKLSCPEKWVGLPNVTVNILPKEALTADWLVGFRVIIPLYMVMAVSQFINFLLILIVGEKERNVKEGMKVMGLRNSVYWLSWFTIYAVFVMVTSLASTFMLCYLGVFQHTSYSLLFLLMFLYSASIIVVAFMITPFFDKAKTAGVVGSFMVNLVSLLYFLQVFVDGSQGALLWLVSLCSPAAFALAMDKALLQDLTGRGVTWATLWEGQGFTFGHALLMLALDIVLYGLITLYLDAVWPSEFGTKQHPLFCFNFLKQRFSNCQVSSETQHEKETINFRNVSTEDVEEVSEELGRSEAIRISGLSKTFSGCWQQPVTALNGFDLVVYENEITAVLGQNGAGKSTLFNILTGLTTPTAGFVHIYNKDIRVPSNMQEVQRMTGVCPQTSIIFEHLTAREHLIFFGRIKGMEPGLLQLSVATVLQDTGLTQQADCPTQTLSGGERRKLSIGIAIIGNPKIIILDEPTAGVDAHSRRQIWSLLQKIKPSKVILLTTHFMEEADIIADRKAVICNGKLRCCGTSIFLKNRFGKGSHLKLTLDNTECSDVIKRVISSYVPGAKVQHFFGKEITFLLPNESVERLAPLLYFIEKEIKSVERKLAISSYGISMCSLEQVFLKLVRDELEDQDVLPVTHTSLGAHLQQDINGINLFNEGDYDEFVHLEDVEYSPNFYLMFRAQLRLQFLRMLRNSQHICFMLVLPIIFSTSGFHISKTHMATDVNTTSILSQDLYPRIPLAVHTTPGVNAEPLLSALGREVPLVRYDGHYASLLSTQPLLGALSVTRCCHPRNLSYTVLYNDTMQHSLPIILNLLHTALYRMLSANKTHSMANPFSVESHQLPVTSQPHEFNIRAVISSVLVGMTFVFLPLSLISDFVYDRESKVKHLLHINGLTRLVYFMAYIITQGVTLLGVSLTLLTVIYYSKLAAVSDAAAYVTMGLVVLFYCPAAILFITCLSYLFDRLQTVQSVMPTLISWIGIIPFVVVAFLDTLGIGNAANVVMSMTNPMYVPFAMFYLVSGVSLRGGTEESCGPLSLGDYLTADVCLLLAGCVLQTLVWSMVLAAVDLKTTDWNILSFLKKIFDHSYIEDKEKKESNENESHNYDNYDIQAEEEKVLNLISKGEESTAVVIVQKLAKEYQKKGSCWSCWSEAERRPAVRDLSFAVLEGEVFGLLGHNGAGKTSTIRIITGEEQPTHGQVWVNGSSSPVGRERVMGYCPQHDALWAFITVREHLQIFASIRGVAPHDCNRVVTGYLRGLGLEAHADKRVASCSGGTRRKLNCAIALLGHSRLSLMDEPSTGMDALSKRFLWDVIRNSFKKNKGAILTTHSMEEAEALCSRVGIMRNGVFRCIGTCQYLKDHYGGGFVLEVKVSSSANKEEVKKFIFSSFVESTMKDNVVDRLVFSIPQHSVKSLADVFLLLEQARCEKGIEMYTFNQTDLEQVFINLSTEKEDNIYC